MILMQMFLQINRTSELARVFGIDFFSVLSRGSQYRVESMFLRLAHTQNYLAISPGNQQVFAELTLILYVMMPDKMLCYLGSVLFVIDCAFMEVLAHNSSEIFVPKPFQWLLYFSLPSYCLSPAFEFQYLAMVFVCCLSNI